VALDSTTDALSYSRRSIISKTVLGVTVLVYTRDVRAEIRGK